METLTAAIMFFDPWLIAPFRWFSHPVAGYVLGVLLLCLQAVVCGDLSAIAVTYSHRKYLRRLQKSMSHHNELAEKALQMADKESFKAINKQSLDSFGHFFSLGAAIFTVSIWPVPFALAWLHVRFAETPLPLPTSLFGESKGVPYLAFFIICYIGVRLFYSVAMTKTGWYRRLKAKLSGQVAS